MRFVFKKVKYILSFLMIAGLIASCTSHPDEEQIKVLEETKSAALAAEKTLADKKQERSSLEAKCEAKKAELEKVKKEKELVMKKLEDRKSEM